MRRRPNGHLISLVVLCLCASALAQGTSSPPSTPASTLPLLDSDGVHLYVHEAFEAFPATITNAVASRRAELVASGMDCSRHLFDWSELQPTPKEITLDFALDQVSSATLLGTPHHFINITVVDSAGPEAIPGFVSELLDAGVPWNDPRIVGPFEALLDELIPAMLDRGVYMIGFANEPSGYYEDYPAAAASFAGFVEQVIEHTRTISEDLATTVVFAGPTDAGIPELMPLIDVATFNGYAYQLRVEPACTLAGTPLPFYRVSGPGTIAPLLDAMILAADGRLVCIQEFGQATGWPGEPSTLGTGVGLELQRDVITAFVESLAARSEHFRTVCLWTLNDHTPDGMQYVVDGLTAEGFPACYAANIAEIFGPTGLVQSDETATTKPAFDVLRAAILPLRERAGQPFDLNDDQSFNFFDAKKYLMRYDSEDKLSDRVQPFGVLDATDVQVFLAALSSFSK